MMCAMWTETLLAYLHIACILAWVVFGMLILTLVFKPTGLLGEASSDRA